VKQYSRRDTSHREHAGEIQREYGLRDFAEVEADLSAWVDARAWTTGEGPKATFDGAVAWLRERRVLLPGVSTLVRLVARVQGDRPGDVLTVRLRSDVPHGPTRAS
jgi:hypothetical protein